jgi:hypothetical protein
MEPIDPGPRDERVESPTDDDAAGHTEWLYDGAGHPRALLVLRPRSEPDDRRGSGGPFPAVAWTVADPAGRPIGTADDGVLADLDGRPRGWLVAGVLYDASGYRVGYLARTCPAPVRGPPAAAPTSPSAARLPTGEGLRRPVPARPPLQVHESPFDLAGFLASFMPGAASGAGW